jgi:hypothetical protein
MKNQPQARKTVGAREVMLYRRLNQGQRGVEPPALMVDLPQAMQRVETVGMMLEDLGVEPLGLGEFAVLMRAQRAAQRLRGIRLQIERRPGHARGSLFVNER